MTNPYQHWIDNLAGRRPAVDETKPQPGYYVAASKDGPKIAAAIWRNGDELLCRVGTDMRDAAAEWPWLARNPISEANARHWFTHGRWPGEDALAAAPSTAKEIKAAASGALTADEAALVGVGHNQPPNEDPYAAILRQVADAIDGARDWLTSIKSKIGTDEHKDIAGNKIGVIRELAGQLAKMHKAEKEPHLSAGRAVDKRYKPVIEQLDDATALLRGVLGTYMIGQQRAAQEAHQKALAEAEKRRQEEIAAGPALPIEPEPEPVAPPAKVQAGGMTGRKVGLRTVPEYVVTDAAAAAEHFANHPELLALLAKLARQDIQLGHVVPGVEVREKTIAA